ncbi:MAG TPA: cytochrome C oxidase subunit IV family protein [Anaeromyxobacter sp.]|nr:cytochrome C oxidase subunit IV family protein [Anaeromyxobacter sp.]
MAETTAGNAVLHSHRARYLAVWVALLFLTVLTYVLARVHLPGAWAVLVALAIAVTKGTLVALFFMHLWEQAGANRLVFATSLVFVALLIGLVIADNATRFPLANPPGSAGALPISGADRDPPAVMEASPAP